MAQMSSGPTKLSQPTEMTAATMAARWPRMAHVRSSLDGVRDWPYGFGLGCVMTPSSRVRGLLRCRGAPGSDPDRSLTARDRSRGGAGRAATARGVVCRLVGRSSGAGAHGVVDLERADG